MISSLLLALVLNAFGAVHTPAELPADRCEEDEVCWDCTTMGNRVCGPPTVSYHVDHWDIEFADGERWADCLPSIPACAPYLPEVAVSAACATTDPVRFPCAPGVTVQSVG